MDQIEIYEIKALMDNMTHRHRESWEQTRLIAYLLAQTHSKKQLKVEDIIKFDWDKEETAGKTPKETTPDEIEDLYRMAEEWKQYLD